MKTNQPFLSFVFCSNSAHHLREFSAGLLRLRCLMSTTNMELLVVGPDTTLPENLVSGLGAAISVRSIPAAWGNRGEARNLGFATATGEWVYFVDQDIRFDPERLAVVARALENLSAYRRSVCLVSGPYLSDRQCTFWGECHNWLANLWLMHSKTGMRVLAGNVLLRKSFYSTLPFDAQLVDGGEELQLCERTRQQGGESHIELGLAAIHRADHSFSRFWRRLRSHAAVKRRLRFDSKKSRVSRSVLWQVGTSPKLWIAVLFWALAEISTF
jgi:glycosyltransferase involved in cell wall biosynthesis